MIKAVLFDMDGTLVDTGEIGFEVFEDYLKEKILEYTKEDVKSIANKGFIEVLKKILINNNKQYLPHMRDELIEKYDKRIQKAKTLPYAIDLLEAIHNKVIMILATFSLTHQMNLIFKNNDLTKYFDIIRCADTGDYKEKKEMIKEIMQEAGLKPEECILVEDSHYGIKSGQHNGIFTIGVKHYFDDIEADIVVEDLEAAKMIILEKLNEDK